MFDPFSLEDIVRIERQILAERQAREARWIEHVRRQEGGGAVSALRRCIARALLVLADRLDPRAVVRVPHVPRRPSMNGTFGHA